MPETKRIETFHISTYGCQMNLADSSSLASALLTRGYRRVRNEEDADLIIFNTCSVRENAEERVFGRLGEVSRFKKQQPHKRIAVVGCMAQRLGEELLERAPYVDHVMGPDRMFELPDAIENREGTSSVMTAFGHENMDVIQPVKENDHSSFVSISRGCNNFCTYCIVPYVRGEERSHRSNHIVDSVKRLTDEGVVEITLLGQNVNSYRHEGMDFPGLLRRLLAETTMPRIRFMTSHPKDLSRRLVDVMAESPRLMPHIHLPLQSGVNRILKRMGRVYTIEHYLDTVEYIRASLEYVSLTTDLIVGFPSETREEYEATLSAVKRIRFDSAFMFRYSVRPGTVAAKFDDDVPEEEKIDRLNRLISLQQDISLHSNQREIGRVQNALVEGFSRRSKHKARARTDGNKIVLFDCDEPEVGRVVPIRVVSADAF
ncbi:MAG: tRNA (N6-isopentenyl adenosine(37)-C2)-methylthiotransferase MiaB, partial [candidate division Zixibacteria bacterium]|nr:tRNA (N6-isopentenyl adenosine(37)-C2)-methylthiotransferase MiaB [candidate division Zixibacteria bacterium]